jgi:uridine kinase
MQPLTAPAELLAELARLSVPSCIGISGRGGAGKSSWAAALGTTIDAPVVGVDSFIRNRDQQGYTCWKILDFERLEAEVLRPFKQGARQLEYCHFDWDANRILTTRTIEPRAGLIVEGVGLFRPSLLPYFSYTLWVNCDEPTATERGKQRDLSAGADNGHEWDGPWRQNDEQYLSCFAPDKAVDWVLENSDRPWRSAD